jgi:hypothetical protein
MALFHRDPVGETVFVCVWRVYVEGDFVCVCVCVCMCVRCVCVHAPVSRSESFNEALSPLRVTAAERPSGADDGQEGVADEV